MKFRHILTAAAVALLTSVQAIEPASAQTQAQISSEDSLFTRQVEGFYGRLGIPSPYYDITPSAEETLVRAHAVMGRAHCSMLREGVPMQFFKGLFNQNVAEGDRDGAILTAALISSAVTVYCPEYASDLTASFRSN